MGIKEILKETLIEAFFEGLDNLMLGAWVLAACLLLWQFWEQGASVVVGSVLFAFVALWVIRWLLWQLPAARPFRAKHRFEDQLRAYFRRKFKRN